MGVVGGGIIGVSVAALLAEEGYGVALYEATEIAAAASGRNSGSIQHPFDPHLAELHRESLELYRALSDSDLGFRLPTEPAGLLVISTEHAAVVDAAAAIRAEAPDLEPQVVDEAALESLEPALAAGLSAVRLATGRPVAPATATRAMAERARRSGTEFHVGDGVESVVYDGEAAVGVRLESGATFACGRVVIAAGPWSVDFVPGWNVHQPLRRVWGVVASTRLEAPPRHVLEELGIDRPGRPPDELFSLMTAGADSSVGSTFLAEQPDPAERAPRLVERAAQFVPAIADAALLGVRACARPQSFDGRPFIGQVPGRPGLWVCVGHGPWGISTGPGSAQRVVEIMQGRAAEDPVFSAARAVTG